ncbi:MAG TPA: hemerythrin domain-containing protein [Myxococcota bacterium]|nr:hemerythrin domain-containing protein [Myxococcota bacterium]
MAKFIVDIYTRPHKDLRKDLFELSMSVAQTDANDDKQIAQVMAQSQVVFDHLDSHARAENTYAHPIIGHKLPHQKVLMDAEHHEHEQDLLNLRLAKETLQLPNTSEMERQNLLLEYYRVLNRFIAHYLMHLDKEEYSMQNLWQLLTRAELFAIMIAFKSNEDVEFLPQFIELARTNLSDKEFIASFAVIRERLGKTIFANTMAQSKKLLSEKEISEIANPG